MGIDVNKDSVRKMTGQFTSHKFMDRFIRQLGAGPIAISVRIESSLHSRFKVVQMLGIYYGIKHTRSVVAMIKKSRAERPIPAYLDPCTHRMINSYFRFLFSSMCIRRWSAATRSSLRERSASRTKINTGSKGQAHR